MGKSFRKIASIAAPVLGTIFAPGLGTALGGMLGAGTGAAASALGTGLIGAGAGALGGGGLKSALTGGALGGLGGFAGAGGFSGLGQTAPGVAGGGLLTSGAMPTGNALNLATGTGSNLLTAGGGLGAGTAINMAGAGAAGLPSLNISGGSSMPSSYIPGYQKPSLFGSLMGKAGDAAQRLGQSVAEPGAMGNNLGKIYSGIQGEQAYKDMARAQQAANQQALQAVSPFQQAGVAAQGRLSSLLGLGGGENQDEMLEQLRNQPGYQFRLEQGQQALDRSLAGRGGLLSGRAVKESQRLGQGLADQTYNDEIRRLQQQSGQGLSAGLGMGGLYGAGGDIQAGQIYGQEDVRNRTLADILNPRGY